MNIALVTLVTAHAGKRCAYECYEFQALLFFKKLNKRPDSVEIY